MRFLSAAWVWILASVIVLTMTGRIDLLLLAAPVACLVGIAIVSRPNLETKRR